MVKKNDTYIVKIEDMGITGEGIGKVDGYALFIKDAVKGDLAEIKVTKAGKNFGYGRLMRVIEPSENRVKPKCPIARSCGGCQLQELSYEEQLRYKENKVYNNLVRIGGLSDFTMHPIIGMDNPYNYRNKAQFPVGINKNGQIISGFYAGRTHSIIESDNCVIGSEINSNIVNIIKKHMSEHIIEPYNEITGRGLVRHILIRVGFKTGQIMVCIVINGNELPHSGQLVEKLKKIDEMTDISLNVNKEKGNVILSDKIINLYGEGYIIDYIDDIKFQISPLSFYQVNPVQTEKLYSTALKYAALTGNETVWDLYCGIGTISLFMARRAKRVFGVEIVPQAIADARQNAKINGITNAEFVCKSAEDIQTADMVTPHPDVIVVDPPRKGCNRVLLDTIVEVLPTRIVYVSCDSATLARDLRILSANGYKVMDVQPVDMFPHSVHIECVVLMSRK